MTKMVEIRKNDRKKDVISDEEHSIVSRVSSILAKSLKLTESAIASKFQNQKVAYRSVLQSHAHYRRVSRELYLKSTDTNRNTNRECASSAAKTLRSLLNFER